MTPDQIDIALAELETRIDRLRALYEQYFMGIERLEPSVPRKDVDRRFHELRKTPFRNTARRFRFQTLVQRYSTMQQYWSRICREIENGTYKRHKLRAERSMALQAAAEAAQEAQSAQVSSETSPPLPEAPPAETTSRTQNSGSADPTDLGALLDAGFDTDAALERAFADALAAPPPKPAAPPATEALGTGLLGRLGQRPDRGAPPGPLPPPRPAAAPVQPPPRPLSPPRPRPSAAPPAQPQVSAQHAPSPAAKPPLPAAKPPTPPPRPAPPAVSPTPSATSSGLDEARIRALHQRYSQARTETNASAVSYEKLEKNLRETEQKLRAQHQGRKIDFDVVIKDGKAILRPKLG